MFCNFLAVCVSQSKYKYTHLNTLSSRVCALSLQRKQFSPTDSYAAALFTKCSPTIYPTLCRCVLSIADAPVCATDREELLGALKHETLQLKCEVDASPPAESFHWTFNSSGEQTELPARLHSSEVSFSIRRRFFQRSSSIEARRNSRDLSDS